MVAVELLDLALDPGLRGVFDENVGAQQNVPVQFGLAGRIAADRVEVDAGADHVVGQNGRKTLVRGAGGDDLGAEDRLLARTAADDLESRPG